MIEARNKTYVEAIMETGERFFGYQNSNSALEIMSTLVRGNNFKRLFGMSMALDFLDGRTKR